MMTLLQNANFGSSSPKYSPINSNTSPLNNFINEGRALILVFLLVDLFLKGDCEVDFDFLKGETALRMPWFGTPWSSTRMLSA